MDSVMSPSATYVHLATLLSAPQDPAVKNEPDYTILKRRIQDAGLLEKRPAYYVLSITTNVVVWTFCLVLVFTVGAIWAQALAAVALGIVSVQLGFQKHNRHHGNPNDVDLDPDIKVGAIAYNDEQAQARRGAGRLAAMYQAYLFFPLTTFLAWSMHAAGFEYLFKEPSRYRRLEFGLLAVHAVLYFGAMFYFLGPWSALMVVLIQKAVGGAYMAAVFAPNHKGMPQTDSSSRMDFVRTQVLTARNVRGHPLTDLWYGSLNYQIEHHLFPGMPRLNMRRAQPIIQQFCREKGIDYHETSFLQSYSELLSFLNEIGAPLRAERRRAEV